MFDDVMTFLEQARWGLGATAATAELVGPSVSTGELGGVLQEVERVRRAADAAQLVLLGELGRRSERAGPDGVREVRLPAGECDPFVGDTAAFLMGCSLTVADRRCRLAARLGDDLGSLLPRMVSGAVPERSIQLVATETRDATPEGVAAVVEHVTSCKRGTEEQRLEVLEHRELARSCRRVLARVDAEALAARAQRNRREVTDVHLDPGPLGTSTVTAVLPSEVGMTVHAAVEEQARQIVRGAPGTRVGAARAQAFADLVLRGVEVSVQVQVAVPASWCEGGDGDVESPIHATSGVSTNRAVTRAGDGVSGRVDETGSGRVDETGSGRAGECGSQVAGVAFQEAAVAGRVGAVAPVGEAATVLAPVGAPALAPAAGGGAAAPINDVIGVGSPAAGVISHPPVPSAGREVPVPVARGVVRHPPPEPTAGLDALAPVAGGEASIGASGSKGAGQGGSADRSASVGPVTGVELPGSGWMPREGLEWLCSRAGHGGPGDSGRVEVEESAAAGSSGGADLAQSGYVPRPALRRAVRDRDGTCRMWGCTRPAASCDLDHAVPWPVGPTSAENLAALCRRHHRLKQQHRWQYALAPDATAVWGSPIGQRRLTLPQPT